MRCELSAFCSSGSCDVVRYFSACVYRVWWIGQDDSGARCACRDNRSSDRRYGWRHLGNGNATHRYPIRSDHDDHILIDIAPKTRLHLPSLAIAHRGNHPNGLDPFKRLLRVAAGLTPTSPGCSSTPSSALACTVNFPLAAGTYTATFTIYDGALSGSPCSGSPQSCTANGTGHILSTYANLPVTIVAGQANAINVSLGGVPTSLLVVALPGGTSPISQTNTNTFSLNSCSASPAHLEVLGLDADSNVIVGPGAPAVTLNESDGHGTLGVAAPTGASPNLFGLTPTMLLSPATRTTMLATVQAQTNASPALPMLSQTFNVVYNGSGSCYPVTSLADAAAAAASPLDPQTGNPIPGTGAGTNGDLRYALFHAVAVAPSPSQLSIVFPGCSTTAPCTVTLNGPLPPIDSNVIVDGGAFGNVIIDGSGKYRAFFADTGSVTLENLQIQNAAATGGAGGVGGGGGGAGLGAGLFVNAATVTVTNDYFVACTVTGGAGGPGIVETVPGTAGAGGGGMFAAGAALSGNQGGGGGGALGSGGNMNPTQGAGGAGGFGGGGGGGGTIDGLGGAGYAGNAAGSNSTGVTGGNGGFGGGGGGGAVSGAGGNGGYGGGGATGDFGSFVVDSAEAGGFGGGGAGGIPGGNSPGFGGGYGGAGLIIFNQKTGGAGGGGGAALGPAIFVNTGTVTITNSGASQAKANVGVGGTTAGGMGYRATTVPPTLRPSLPSRAAR